MSKTNATPKHLWIIGIISLPWNMMGAFDYLMTQTRNEAYLAQFEQAQLDYYFSFPTLVVAFWALAVWSSVLGSILLLMRKRLAMPVFMVSLAAMIITAIYNFGISDGMEVAGTSGFVFTVVIFFVALGLVLYSRAMRARGVLA
jgi:hypothetical protein